MATHDSPSDLSRRELLKLGGLAAFAGAAASLSQTGKAAAQVVRAASPLLPQDLSVDLFMTPNQPVQVRASGAMTNTWRYTGVVTGGNPAQLAPGPGYLGPTFVVDRGQRVNVRMVNNLAEHTITHWHGLDVPADQDGHPLSVVDPGQEYNYSFDVTNRAGTYWYHPHPDMILGNQVIQGLAGFFVVRDREEQRLALPRGYCDFALCLQDRRFNTSNQFVYTPGSLAGFVGNTILVNGQENYTHHCGTRCYRVRILNGSNSRIYKLAFSDGTPMIVIGSDGGLLAKPVTKPYVMLAPGERVELWVDLRAKAIGAQIKLRSLAFNPVLGTGGSFPNGAAFDVCTFNMAYTQAEQLSAPPAYLSAVPKYRLQDAINANNPRQWNVGVDAMGMFVVNGGMYMGTEVAPNEVVKADTLEVIEFNNPVYPYSMPHPMHMHGRQFQILSRELIDPVYMGPYVDVEEGLLDEGWKDTFILWPGERVRILVRHSKHTGLYVYHCHNLEHEDMGMMRNFRIDP